MYRSVYYAIFKKNNFNVLIKVCYALNIIYEIFHNMFEQQYKHNITDFYKRFLS